MNEDQRKALNALRDMFFLFANDREKNTYLELMQYDLSETATAYMQAVLKKKWGNDI